MEEAAITSPFVFFKQGTSYFPPNDIHEATETILKEIVGFSPGEAVKELTKYRPLTPFTWHPAFHTLFRFEGIESGLEHLQSGLLRVLGIMTRRPAHSAWKALLAHFLEYIDLFSGWSCSWQKEHAEREPVTIGEDGRYYIKSYDGTMIQVLGMKTFPETRLDYISDSILRPYGRIRQILNVFSLFAISDDFAAHPEAYPSVMRLVLGDGEWYMGRHPWHRTQFAQIRSTRWRPPSNLCDPEWLAEEMLARLISPLTTDPWRETIAKHQERGCHLDPDCTRQLDCVLNTNLFIGDEDEVYFEFEGRTFRWINGTAESSAVLSVGVRDEAHHYRSDFEAINRLLTTLIWQHHAKIVQEGGVVGARRPVPWIRASRLSGGLKISLESRHSLTSPTDNDKAWLALALFKEGRNSNSVFYEFLSYWKAIEVALPDKNARWTWINSNVTRAGRGEPLDIGTAKSAAEYLDYSGRCAIAHVFRSPSANPDDFEDKRRISKDVYLVEELARLALREIMGIK